MAGQEKLPAYFVTPSVLQAQISASAAAPTQITP